MSRRLMTLVFLSRFSCKTAFAQMKRKIPMPMIRGPKTFSLSEYRYLQNHLIQPIRAQTPVETFNNKQLLISTSSIYKST